MSSWAPEEVKSDEENNNLSAIEDYIIPGQKSQVVTNQDKLN
jgi:hypothetical protein